VNISVFKEKGRMPNIVDYFFQQNNIQGLKFSMCVSNMEGGFLSFGTRNTDKFLPEAKTYTVPISRPSGQYNINIHSMKVLENNFIYIELFD